LRARKTKRYGQRVPIVSYYVGSLAATIKNLRRKGVKFDHRPGRPKVLLRHWPHLALLGERWEGASASSPPVSTPLLSQTGK